MAGQMWFGTKGHEQWVPAPATGADWSRKSYTTGVQQFINGGAGLARSRASHFEFNMTWNTDSRDDLRPILDYAHGVYDTDFSAPNLIYFSDPMAMDKNVAPLSWGFAALASESAPSLLTNTRPTTYSVGANSHNLPARGAVYALSTSNPSKEQYIPVPPGYDAYIVAWASASGSARVMANSTNLTLSQSANSPTVVKISNPGSITLSLATDSTGTLNLIGLVIKLSKTTLTAAAFQQYVSPQGNSGVMFEDEPQVTAYSAVIPNAEISMTATLVEVGAWLQ